MPGNLYGMCCAIMRFSGEGIGREVKAGGNRFAVGMGRK